MSSEWPSPPYIFLYDALRKKSLDTPCLNKQGWRCHLGLASGVAFFLFTKLCVGSTETHDVTFQTRASQPLGLVCIIEYAQFMHFLQHLK